MKWKLQRELQYIQTMLDYLYEGYKSGKSSDYYYTQGTRDKLAQRKYEIQQNLWMSS